MLVSACVQVPAMLPHNLEEQMNVSLRVGARDGARLSQPNRSPEITTAQCPALPPAPSPPLHQLHVTVQATEILQRFYQLVLH